MSLTPRTDAIKPVGAYHHFRVEDFMDLARTLETELAATQAKLAEEQQKRFQMEAQYVRDIEPLMEDDHETPKHVALQAKLAEAASANVELLRVNNGVKAKLEAAESAIARAERDARRYQQARTMPFVLDHSRITPQRPDKFDALIDIHLPASSAKRGRE